MALGGIQTAYDSTVPPDSENAGLGAQRIRSLETTIQQVLDSEHNFPAAGGANTGYHRLGSGRAFYGPESAVSSSGTDGRLMITSDTSRLFHVGSGGTMFLGGNAASLVTSPNNPGPSQMAYWAVEVALQAPDSFGSITGTFASAFSGVPFVFLCPVAKTAAQRPFAWLVTNPSTTGFAGKAWDQNANSALTQTNVLSVSIGTRAL